MTIFQRIRSSVRARWSNRQKMNEVRRSIAHVAGPAMTRLGPHDVALVLLGRNVGYFLAENVARHRAMGVRHVVYLDNGSTDDSVKIMSGIENVTVATCGAQFRTHQNWIRFCANTMFLDGGWRLSIDPDEILDYPGSDHLSLPDLTRHLSARGFDAMVAHMLDMAPAGPLTEAPQATFAEAIGSFDHYSLENFSADDYHRPDSHLHYFLSQNQISNPQIQVLYGGLRRSAFNEHCCLIKHPLFRMGPGIRPQPHPHVTTGVRCADFTAVLKHYKLAGGILERERKLLSENRISHPETALRVARLSEQPDLDFSDLTRQSRPSVEKLIGEGFLQITPAARSDLGLAPADMAHHAAQ